MLRMQRELNNTFHFARAEGIDTAITCNTEKLAQEWILIFRAKLSEKGYKTSPLRKVDVGLRGEKS